MSTTESLGEAASILASFASIAENSAEQQPVSTEPGEVVNDANHQAQIEQLMDSVGSFQQQIQTHELQSQLAGMQRSIEQQPMQQQLLMQQQLARLLISLHLCVRVGQKFSSSLPVQLPQALLH